MHKFRQFYIDNGDKLFGYLLRKSGNTHLAADLVQETFTRYLERYRNREQSPALLFTIGRNLFYDQMRFIKRFIPGRTSVRNRFRARKKTISPKKNRVKSWPPWNNLAMTNRTSSPWSSAAS